MVERVHGTWAASFWNKNHFASARALARKSPRFLLWYQTYAPPALGGVTVKQAATQLRCRKLLRRQIAQIPAELPLTAGRLHFLRKVDAQGRISILKEHWHASKTLSGHYLWATRATRQAALFLYHRPSERAHPRLIRHYGYALEEKVHKLKPAFHRRTRKVDILRIMCQTRVRPPTARRRRVLVKNRRVVLASCARQAVARMPVTQASQPSFLPHVFTSSRHRPRCRGPCFH